MTSLSDATERMLKRSVESMKKDAEDFSRSEQGLYNIFMNQMTGYEYTHEEEAEVEEEKEGYEKSFGYTIDRLQEKLNVVLELLQLNQTREKLNRDLQAIKAKEGSEYKVEFIPRWDSFECLGRDVVLAVLRSLEALVLEEEKISQSSLNEESTSAEKQKRLNDLLKSTAHWVSIEAKKIGRAPTKESDVQSAMRTLLQSHFMDEYVEGFSIPKYVKNFKPDGGVKSIRTAIEYKFVNSQDNLAKATGALFEDIIGYGDSRDWEFFFSVIYMTESFMDPEALMKDLRKKGKGKWHPIVVVGENMVFPKDSKLNTTHLNDDKLKELTKRVKN